MARKIYCVPIDHLRDEMFATYSMFEVPDMKDILPLNGDYSWSEIKDLRIKENSWKTFKANPQLWKLFESVTACYVSISEPDSNTGRIVFYRDQQDCILWSVDPSTGKVYDNTDNLVADDVEEFWARMWIENQLWRLYAYNQPKNICLIQNSPLAKYAQFYLDFSGKSVHIESDEGSVHIENNHGIAQIVESDTTSTPGAKNNRVNIKNNIGGVGQIVGGSHTFYFGGK